MVVSEPSELSPREAMYRYLDRRRSELTDETVQSYRYRLKLWIEWCEREGITHVSEFSGWVFEQYESHRSGKGIETVTLSSEMKTLKGYVEYLERIEAVPEGLSKKVHLPDVPKEERSRDERLSTERAQALLQHYRASEVSRAGRNHVFLELLWHTGARIGGIRALDLRDFYPEEGCIEFVHRPSTDTPLKNKTSGERMVGLREPVIEVIQEYIKYNRRDILDDHGRSPLLTTQQGRPSKGALRTWCYLATHPCVAGPCPHDRNIAVCEFRNYSTSSQCPSSKSPHHVRTGSISWHRDCGYPREVVSERVNASESVIEEFYDKSTKRQRMNMRRRPHLHKLDIEENRADDETDATTDADS